MKLRSLVTVGVVIAAGQVLTGCGDTADQDLCTQYAGLLAAADEWQQQDPLTAKADELRAASEKFQDELDQVQAAAEGRLDTAISTLQANIDAFRQAAIEDDSEALDAARPLLEDAKEDVDEAWAVVEALADMQCDAT
jgi:hypothetical protein